MEERGTVGLDLLAGDPGGGVMVHDEHIRGRGWLGVCLGGFHTNEYPVDPSKANKSAFISTIQQRTNNKILLSAKAKEYPAILLQKHE